MFEIKKALWLIALALVVGLSLPALAEEPSLVDETSEIQLPNGLRIFVLERDFSPTFATYYQFGVGGAVDPKGRSGIAHLLEHMMFKGSENIGTTDRKREKQLMAQITEAWHELDAELARQEDPYQAADTLRIGELRAEIQLLSEEHKQIIVKNEYDELMTRAGGVWQNASTGWDVTNYFIQLPANQLEFWFQMQADRLLNPVFREFYSERDVVREERRLRYENRAEGLSSEAINGLLFAGHPYSTPVIGWPADVERLKREDAEAYFRTYYSPNNCTMVLVGDVDGDEVERLARKYLGKWQRQEIPPMPASNLLPQRGEKRQMIEFDAEPSLDMGWLSVPDGHPDSYSLSILARILGGMRSSRLDQELVQNRKIAASVYATSYTSRYAGSFEAGGRPQGEHSVAELESAIREIIESIKNEGVTTEEVERAKVSTEVSEVRRLESNLWTAFSIGRTVGRAGELAYLDEYKAAILAVTPEEVQAVAQRYLTPEAINVVEVRRPEDAGDGSGKGYGGEGPMHSRGAPPGERGAVHSKGFKKMLSELESAPPVEMEIPVVGEDVQRRVLPSGITVFTKEDPSLPRISMQLNWLGGSNTTPVEALAPFEFAGDLLQEGGTKDLDPQALEVRVDELGMQFSSWIGSTQSAASFWSLSRNFDEAFALAVDILTEPRLDEERLAVLKAQHAVSMKRRFDSPRRAVSVLSNQVLYADQPRRSHVTGKAEAEAVTAADVRQVLDRYLGRDNLYVTVVGDFETEAMLALIEDKLGQWSKAKDAERVFLAHAPSIKPGVFVVEKDLPQPAVRIVQELAVDRTASPEEHAAIEILNDILGGSGFRSRLMERLRSDEGLTYGIYSRFSHEGRPGFPGRLEINYQTRKDAVLHSIESVLEVYMAMLEEGVTEAEVNEQIQTWRNTFIFRFENEFYSVSRLMGQELDDRPYEFDQTRLAMIQSVTKADVDAVARKLLDPANLSIFVFGSLTPEDEAAMAETFGLEKLEKEVVFAGGY